MKLLPLAESLPGQLQSVVADNMAALSLEQVAQLSGVATLDLKRLVDYGVLKPVTPVSDPWEFHLDCVMTLQHADRLRQDLALDDNGFALAMMLVSQITDVEDELRTTRPRLHAGDYVDGRANPL